MLKSRDIVWHNLAFLLALLSIAAIAWQAMRTQEALLQANGAVTRSLERIAAIGNLLTTLQDVETGERGFVITQAPAYLVPYERALARIGPERERLGRMLQEVEVDGASTQTLAGLDALVERRLGIAAANIRTRQEQGLEVAARQLGAAGGRETMEALRELLGALEAAELERLAQRTAAVNAQLDSGQTLAVGGGLLIAVLLLAALLAINRNLRRRRQLAQSAQADAARLAAILDAVPDTLVSLGHNGSVEILGSGDARSAGLPTDLVGPLHAQREASERSASPATFDLQSSDGRDYEIRLVPVHDSEHLAVIRDMTEALRTRRRLRDQQAFLRTVVDADENMIFVRDSQGRFLLCNQAFSDLLGLWPSQVEGRTAAQLEREALLEPLLADEREILNGLPELRVGNLAMSDRFGQQRWLQVLKRPLRLSDGGRKVLTVAVDVSERHAIERMKLEFVSTVSHELRTPLTAIRGALSMLSSGMGGDIPASARPLLDVACKNSERLVKLIDDILDFEKLGAGRLMLDLRERELLPLVNQAITDIGPYAREFDVELRRVGAGDARVRVDADRFAQIMANLLSNAIKHSPPGGSVEVGLSVAEGFVEVSVADHGAGIPEAFRSRVFERFAQADASDARQRGGTGLGLAITRSLVDLHGGSIGFDTETDHGTRFHVRLPRAGAPPLSGDSRP